MATGTNGASEKPKSRFTGVTWDSRTMLWRTQINIGKRCLHLGYFKDAAVGAAAFDAACVRSGRAGGNGTSEDAQAAAIMSGAMPVLLSLGFSRAKSGGTYRKQMSRDGVPAADAYSPPLTIESVTAAQRRCRKLARRVGANEMLDVILSQARRRGRGIAASQRSAAATGTTAPAVRMPPVDDAVGVIRGAPAGDEGDDYSALSSPRASLPSVEGSCGAAAGAEHWDKPCVPFVDVQVCTTPDDDAAIRAALERQTAEEARREEEDEDAIRCLAHLFSKRQIPRNAAEVKRGARGGCGRRTSGSNDGDCRHFGEPGSGEGGGDASSSDSAKEARRRRRDSLSLQERKRCRHGSGSSDCPAIAAAGARSGVWLQSAAAGTKEKKDLLEANETGTVS